MNIDQIIGDSAMDVLPQGLRDFIADYLSGNVRQFILVVETNEKMMASMIHFVDDETSDVYAMIGALEVVKRDYMRQEVESLVEYKREDEEE